MKCHCGAWEKCPDFDPNNPTWGGHCLDAPDDSYSSACIMDFPCGTDERKDAYCSPKGDECPQGWMGYNWEDKE
ncbi:MAG: hypothetical protein JSU94_10010 [Phycisphaerales bacterium]|nr:MAG: hypothetical protein JSU94_10010 [Phycisphaerales bacterium]